MKNKLHVIIKQGNYKNINMIQGKMKPTGQSQKGLLSLLVLVPLSKYFHFRLF